MKRFKRRTIIAYFFAAVGVSLATELRYLLHPLLGEHMIFSLYFLAVSIAAWGGGFGPAMVTALISSVLANYLFTEPRGVLEIANTEQLVALLMFFGVSFVIGVMSEISLRAQDRVREAEQQKDDFLAILAHELRNPLAIIHYTNLAEEQAVDGRRHERSEIIDQQVQQLDQMIEDLLDISKVSRGKFRLQLAPVDVGTLVENAVDKAEDFIHGRGHEFVVERPTEEMTVWGDSARLLQVLTNLLTNAARYTPKGGKILLQTSRENSQAVFRVCDNGLGIHKEMLSRIFDLQTQVSRSLESSGSSLGVGLALARTLVELHGGTISAVSDGPDKGSEFTVRLPLYRLAAAPAAPAAKSV